MSTKKAHSKLEEIVRRFEGVEVGVVGDLMLDELLRGEATRISPEAPVPVVLIRHSPDGEGFLGGSGNVAANVAALGGRASVFGVVGKDSTAKRLKALLRNRGIDASGVLEEDGHVTPRKVRVVAQQHQLVRVDFERPQPFSARANKGLARRIAQSAPKLGALIVSDYLKGTVSDEVCAAVRAAASELKLPVLVDPKPERPETCRGATLATPNLHEAERMAGTSLRDAEARQQNASALLEKLGCKALLVTRGGDGMTLVEPGGSLYDIPGRPRPVYDVTGAGDTVIAVMALALAAGAPMRAAAEIANVAGGCVVLKFGTAVITPGELIEALRSGV